MTLTHLPARALGDELTARAACLDCTTPGVACEPHRITASVKASELLFTLNLDVDRINRSIGVGARMSDLLMGSTVTPVEFSQYVVAALLHDVGHSPSAADAPGATGQRSIDGARWLRAHHFPARVCSLVAWHSTSTWEVELRNLGRELAEFNRSEAPDYAHDLLWQSDFTVDHRGDFVTVDERIEAIHARYGPDLAPAVALDAAIAAGHRERAFATSAPGRPH